MVRNIEDHTIRYIVSNTYAQIIHATVSESGLLCVNQEVTEGFSFLKFVKQNMNSFTALDMFLVDLSALEDVDEEILKAVEMLRYMDDELRIIVLAPNRYKGDPLLKKCFNMGIYNLVCTDDFVVIKEELLYCFNSGKKYKDAQDFRDALPIEKILVKQEIKQTVNKILISTAGSHTRMGVTHLCILLAAYLRKRGYMVAAVEMNPSRDFERIKQGYDEKPVNDHFTIDGIDFYSEADAEMLSGILAKSYNFVIGDFGSYRDCDKVTYAKGDVRLVVAGAKAWELDYLLNDIFPFFEEDALKELNFIFNMVNPESKKAIQEGMKELGVVYFQDYRPDPFSPEFNCAEEILKKYMPVKKAEKRRTLFGKRG